MMVLAYRPPHLPHLAHCGTAQVPGFTRIQLDDLDHQQAQQLLALKLEQVFGRQFPLAPALADRIIERSGGNPFFIEELLNYLKNQGFGEKELHTLERERAAVEPAKPDSQSHRPTAGRTESHAESGQHRRAQLRGRDARGFYPQLGATEQIKEHLDVLTQAVLTVREQPEPDLGLCVPPHAHAGSRLREPALCHPLDAARAAGRLHRDRGGRVASTNMLDQLAYHYALGHNESKKAGVPAQGRRVGRSTSTPTLQRSSTIKRVLPLLSGDELPQILLDLGRVYELVGRWQDARASYEQALAVGSGQRSHHPGVV